MFLILLRIKVCLEPPQLAQDNSYGRLKKEPSYTTNTGISIGSPSPQHIGSVQQLSCSSNNHHTHHNHHNHQTPSNPPKSSYCYESRQVVIEQSKPNERFINLASLPQQQTNAEPCRRVTYYSTQNDPNSLKQHPQAPVLLQNNQHQSIQSVSEPNGLIGEPYRQKPPTYYPSVESDLIRLPPQHNHHHRPSPSEVVLSSPPHQRPLPIQPLQPIQPIQSLQPQDYLIQSPNNNNSIRKQQNGVLRPQDEVIRPIQQQIKPDTFRNTKVTIVDTPSPTPVYPQYKPPVLPPAITAYVNPDTGVVTTYEAMIVDDVSPDSRILDPPPLTNFGPGETLPTNSGQSEPEPEYRINKVSY